MRAHFLEVNPGPDFKQTGDQLKLVIEELFEQTCQIILDQNILQHINTTNTSNNTTTNKKEAVNATCSRNKNEVTQNDHRNMITEDFQLVYDKEWSVSKMSGGFSFH